eukprot:m.167536 g.167536  ORF g.167536 m.167536 type:complete len:140 (+) comp53172_c0_seq6:1195-1614(+)
MAALQKDIETLQSSHALKMAESEKNDKQFKAQRKFAEGIRDVQNDINKRNDAYFKNIEAGLRAMQLEAYELKLELRGLPSDRLECQRCRQPFFEASNTDRVCKFHPSGYDETKGFLCCQVRDKTAPGCLTTRHLAFSLK